MGSEGSFRDREDAGRRLGERLEQYRDEDPIILALPRGGVPVAYEISRALRAPLDIFIARKLGAPRRKEFGIGAVAQGGVLVLNERAVEVLEIPEEYIGRAVSEETEEIERRLRLLRGDRPEPEVGGRTVILVDDGLATGASMRAAAVALSEQEAGEVVVAVPVAPPETCAAFKDRVDRVICARTPELFYAVGAWYDDFSEVGDDDVRHLLRRAADLRAGEPDSEVRVPSARET